MESGEQFTTRLLDRLAQIAYGYVFDKIPSKQLRTGLAPVVVDPQTAYLEIPHYWALYVHDGRGPFEATRSVHLIWFRNINDDPRLLNGQTPERASDLRELTLAEYKFWIGQNRIAIKNGVPPPMILRTKVGGVRGTFFFDNEVGMKGFPEIAAEVVLEEFLSHIDSSLRGFIDSKTDRAIAVI